MYPQVLINVRVAKGVDCLGHDRVKSAVYDAERVLDGKGRVLSHLGRDGLVDRVVVVDSVTAAHDHSGRGEGPPRKAEARRNVVPVRLDERERGSDCSV